MKKIFIVLFVLTMFLCFSNTVSAQIKDSSHAWKFGLFDIEAPAVGIAYGLQKISPHLHLNFDGDVILAGKTKLLLDLTLRYLFDGNRKIFPYMGGGLGGSIRDNDKTFTSHLVGGFDFRIDTIPVFTELKIHLKNPEAVSLWFGLRY